MNPKLTIQKLVGYSDNLLTFYLGVARKYSILEPMISCQTVCDANGSGTAAEGFKIIRESLYYSVVQDIANIVFDSGPSNPSIRNIVEKLKKEVVKHLREKYTTRYCPDEELETIMSNERGKEFDNYLNELFHLAEDVQKNSEIKAAKSVRDEFTAHLDLQYDNGSYRYPDIGKYGLRWNSPRDMIDLLKPVIVKIGFVVRGACFDWKSFEAQNKKIATGYWEAASANKPSKEMQLDGTSS